MDNSKIKAGYELTPASHKAEVEIEAPGEALNELGLATARLIDSIRRGSQKVGNMLCNSASMLGKPIGALIEGQTAKIELNNQFITANLMYAKETNATMHLNYVAEELNKKVQNNEPIPEKIEKSDNLYLIQDHASTTSNEELLRLWAKLYTEEACKPGTVSRKTINLVQTLDIKIVKLLEEQVFPYCDENGFYWGSQADITHLILLTDYGLIEENSILNCDDEINKLVGVRLNELYTLYYHPNFGYGATFDGAMYRLTNPAKEIYKNINKKVNIANMDIIFENIKKASALWKVANPFLDKIKLKQLPNINQKYVICNKNNNVVSPINSQFKTLKEFENFAFSNIEIIN